jgi:HTH-type transcriptional regulator / antitoxin HigA
MCNRRSVNNEHIIANERQARDIALQLEEIESALSSEQVLKSLVEGLPTEIIQNVRDALVEERSQLNAALSAYKSAKDGQFDQLARRAGTDPGAQLIVARVARGWSQKELARRLFIPEQQIQRYEAERYRSISLGNLIRVARALGVRLRADLVGALNEPWIPTYEMSAADAQKVLKHAKHHDWLDRIDQSDENSISQLKRAVAEHVGEYGTPSLLRTGLNIQDHSNDWLLLSWKAQVTRRVLAMPQRGRVKYRMRNLSWLMDLVKLSRLDDGPIRAVHMLAEHGILLITEPHIVGMKVDGAAFLVDDIPVIALTLLKDTVDNFWFTLLHEIAHVVLHYRTGLSSGFFDEMDHRHTDDLEAEADAFASNILIPNEIWSRSPIRISKEPGPIVRFAEQLQIAPEIVFGRIRKERGNYQIFADKIGQGKIRPQLFDFSEVQQDDKS